MRMFVDRGQSRWCFGMMILLLTLAVPPTRGEALSDDILELSQQMVARERVCDYVAALMMAQKALTIAEDTLGPEVAEVAIYSDYVGGLHLTAMDRPQKDCSSGRWPSENRYWAPITWWWQLR